MNMCNVICFNCKEFLYDFYCEDQPGCKKAVEQDDPCEKCDPDIN